MRLYKMQITGYPEEAIQRVETDEVDNTRTTYLKSGWKPEGWEKYVDECIEDGYPWAQRAKDEGYRFFWPSDRRTYLTKEAAESKAWIVRKWGGTAIVLEAEVAEFVETEEAARTRRNARAVARADRLRTKAQELMEEARRLVVFAEVGKL